MTRTPRLRPRVVGAVVATVAAFGVGGSAIGAQTPEDAEGAADFRTAPRLTSGRFTDSVVAGESVWYSALYTNSVPKRITATLRTPPPEGSTFKVEFVAPTLGVAGTGEADTGTTEATTTGSYTYSAGGTNTRFVTVTLDSPTDVGTAFDFDLELEGFNDGRTEDCAALPDCVSDEELESANERLEAAKSELSERTSATPEALEAEISDLESRPGEPRGPAGGRTLGAARDHGAVGGDCRPRPGRSTADQTSSSRHAERLSATSTA